MIKKLCALGLFLFATNTMASNDKISICATSQMYHALDAISMQRNDIETYIASPSDLYAKISNNEIKCNIVISSDEKLPIELIRSNKAEAASMQPLVRAPLILWSKNPYLFKNSDTKVITDKKLKSIALADTALTPVGFATHQIVSSSAFPTNYIKDRIYRGSHEYQVFSMVDSENVESGFITMPLIKGINKMANGSYWVVPKSYHADILYYITLVDKGSNLDHVVDVYKYLKHDEKCHEMYEVFGFELLNSTQDKGEKPLKGFN